MTGREGLWERLLAFLQARNSLIIWLELLLGAFGLTSFSSFPSA